MQAQDSTHETGVRGEVEHRDGSNVYRARNRKAAAALQMQVAGAELSDIAEVLGYPTERAVRVAIEQALERELHEESKETLRKMVASRYNRLLRAAWEKAIDGNCPDQAIFMLRAKDITDSFVKLYGLAAPQEVVMYSPAQQELEAWVARAISSTVPAVEEGDIFDGEVIDGEVVN